MESRRGLPQITAGRAGERVAMSNNATRRMAADTAGGAGLFMRFAFAHPNGRKPRLHLIWWPSFRSNVESPEFRRNRERRTLRSPYASLVLRRERGISKLSAASVSCAIDGERLQRSKRLSGLDGLCFPYGLEVIAGWPESRAEGVLRTRGKSSDLYLPADRKKGTARASRSAKPTAPPRQAP
jgi:hypothetical protein